jgi:hypothetical protein
MKIGLLSMIATRVLTQTLNPLRLCNPEYRPADDLEGQRAHTLAASAL